MFQFKQFTIRQELCAMKVGTDGVLLGAWAQGGARILDAGTGTGVIALMMAQRYPEAQVTAIDIDEGAVRQAQQNVEQAPFARQVTVVHEALQEHQGEYDAVVSNPPFFIDSLAAPDEQRNMARHTATLTYGQLMQAAYRLLSDEGELSVVVPFDYRQRMEDEARVCCQDDGTKARQALPAGIQETPLPMRERTADDRLGGLPSADR